MRPSKTTRHGLRQLYPTALDYYVDVLRLYSQKMIANKTSYDVRRTARMPYYVADYGEDLMAKRILI